MDEIERLKNAGYVALVKGDFHVNIYLEWVSKLIEQARQEEREKIKGKLDLLEAIAFYSLAVMTELEQDGTGIVGHLLDSDDNPGQYLRNLLIKHKVKLDKTAYHFLTEGEQIEKGGYTDVEDIIATSKIKVKVV